MILITGSSGFVGSNLLDYLSNNELNAIGISLRNENIFLNDQFDTIIHLAGKAHDLKKYSNVQDYYDINTKTTINLFDTFLSSRAKVFITLSSVKAVADVLDCELTEDHIPKPESHYGKSKLLAEKYILNTKVPDWKRVYILRPCMIHGPRNKGNLNLLYKIVSSGFPWPLGAFENKRSFCSIENLCFVIKELINRNDIDSGVYNIADDEPISTNELINLIANTQNKTAKILNIPKSIIVLLSKVGDVFNFSLNTEHLQKLTENYIVSNNKLLKSLGKALPVKSKDGLIKTFKSFNH